MGEEGGWKTVRQQSRCSRKPVSCGVFSINFGVLHSFPEQVLLLKGSSPVELSCHLGHAVEEQGGGGQQEA
jgi:hypothetical protein